MDNKMLTGNAKTTVNFKLQDTEFSLLLMPSSKQRDNALLTMQSGLGTVPYKDPHWSVKKFDSFKKLGAEDIDSIVRTARGAGKSINATDISINRNMTASK